MLPEKMGNRFLTGKTGFLIISLLLTSFAHAQPERLERFSLFLDGSNHSAAEKDGIRRRVLNHLQSRGVERTELKNLNGSIVTKSACPVGFVRHANYQFSIKEITIIKDEGVDCDSARQCRAWQIEAEPEDAQQPYDFSLQLQCTTDDTLPNRSHSEIDTMISAGALGKSKD